MDEIDKLRKKIRKDAEDLYEVDDNSDIPIHEKFVKEKKIRKIKDGFREI